MPSPTRFDHWSPVARAGVLLGVVVLVAWGLLAGSHVPKDIADSDPDLSNVSLYTALQDAVAGGENYYDAVGREQPLRDFPTSPTSTVREPTSSYLVAALGGPTPAHGVLLALGVAVVGLMVWRFGEVAPGRAAWVVACLLGTTAIAPIAAGPSVLHEVWVAPLLASAVLLRGRVPVVVPVCLVLLALLVRELVAPFVLAMIVVSWLEGRVRDALLWLASCVPFAVFYGWHAHQVATHLDGIGDPSEGWVRFGGWPFIVDSMWFSPPLCLGPYALAAVVAPFALLGWWSQRGQLAQGATAVVVAFAVVMSVVGRDDNVYWGLMYAGILLPGLAWAPRAIQALARRASDRVLVG